MQRYEIKGGKAIRSENKARLISLIQEIADSLEIPVAEEGVGRAKGLAADDGTHLIAEIGGKRELADMIGDGLTAVEKPGGEERLQTLADFSHLVVKEGERRAREEDVEGLEYAIVDVVGIEAAQQKIVEREAREKGEELGIVERESDLATKELVDAGGIVDIGDIDIASDEILEERPRGDGRGGGAFEATNGRRESSPPYSKLSWRMAETM